MTLQERSEQRVHESASKYNGEAFEFINCAWRECHEELYYDAISGEAMVKELVEAARRVEMGMLKKHGV